jgi:hypothetical protein
MLASLSSNTQRQQCPEFAVFGQTWYFTRPALSALHLYGLGSRKSLKALIIKMGTSSGMAVGTHEICYEGVDLRLSVEGQQVLVVDPFFTLTTQYPGFLGALGAENG